MIKKYILAAININLIVYFSLLLIIGFFKIKIYPFEKAICISFLLFLIIIFSTFSYLSKNKNLYNIGVFANFIINIILIYNIVNLNYQYDYILNIFNNNYNYVTYNIYVQKRTPIYNNIEKLNGQKIGMLNKNEENIKNYLDYIVEIEYVSYEKIDDIVNAIDNGEIQCFILTEADFNNINEESTNIKYRVRKIYSNKIKDTY